MRTLMLILCSALSVACTAMASDTQIVRIPAKADTLLMINGQWVPAQGGCYRVVMDSNITVNGVEYVPKEQPPVPYEEPSLERCFVDYMVRKPYEEAQKIIDAGGSYDDAYKFMDNFYRQYESDSLKVEFRDGFFHLHYHGQEMLLQVPRHKTEPKVAFSYRKAVLEPRFRELCDTLEKGSFTMRTTSAIDYVQPGDVPLVIQWLREVPQRAKIRKYVGKVPIYEPMAIKGRNWTYRLSEDRVAAIVNAAKK